MEPLNNHHEMSHKKALLTIYSKTYCFLVGNNGTYCIGIIQVLCSYIPYVLRTSKHKLWQDKAPTNCRSLPWTSLDFSSLGHVSTCVWNWKRVEFSGSLHVLEWRTHTKLCRYHGLLGCGHSWGTQETSSPTFSMGTEPPLE